MESISKEAAVAAGGQEFNLGSPQQLAEVLYTQLKAGSFCLLAALATCLPARLPALPAQPPRAAAAAAAAHGARAGGSQDAPAD